MGVHVNRGRNIDGADAYKAAIVKFLLEHGIDPDADISGMIGFSPDDADRIIKGIESGFVFVEHHDYRHNLPKRMSDEEFIAYVRANTRKDTVSDAIS